MVWILEQSSCTNHKSHNQSLKDRLSNSVAESVNRPACDLKSRKMEGLEEEEKTRGCDRERLFLYVCGKESGKDGREEGSREVENHGGRERGNEGTREEGREEEREGKKGGKKGREKRRKKEMEKGKGKKSEKREGKREGKKGGEKGIVIVILRYYQ